MANRSATTATAFMIRPPSLLSETNFDGVDPQHSDRLLGPRASGAPSCGKDGDLARVAVHADQGSVGDAS